MLQYNRYVKRYYIFCADRNVTFPCVEEQFIATYLCCVAEDSARPKSVLNGTMAALTCLFDAMELNKAVLHGSITKLVDGLVKSATVAPMIKTAIMPVKPFHDLFTAWPDNGLLTLKDLRMKVICLMALVFMLRPSDVAPHGQYLDPESLAPVNMVFGKNQIQFHDNGDLSVTFHSIKNDAARDGFKVTIPPCPDRKLDVASALLCYMTRTAGIRNVVPKRPVFITLQRPYQALSASAVSKILGDAVKAAGLSGYTAKNFRPTGASQAVAQGLKPDVARHIGRWRSQEVFDKHYVHTHVPSDYLADMLC